MRSEFPCGKQKRCPRMSPSAPGDAERAGIPSPAKAPSRRAVPETARQDTASPRQDVIPFRQDTAPPRRHGERKARERRRAEGCHGQKAEFRDRPCDGDGDKQRADKRTAIRGERARSGHSGNGTQNKQNKTGHADDDMRTTRCRGRLRVYRGGSDSAGVSRGLFPPPPSGGGSMALARAARPAMSPSCVFDRSVDLLHRRFRSAGGARFSDGNGLYVIAVQQKGDIAAEN